MNSAYRNPSVLKQVINKLRRSDFNIGGCLISAVYIDYVTIVYVNRIISTFFILTQNNYFHLPRYKNKYSNKILQEN